MIGENAVDESYNCNWKTNKIADLREYYNHDKKLRSDNNTYIHTYTMYPSASLYINDYINILREWLQAVCCIQCRSQIVKFNNNNKRNWEYHKQKMMILVLNRSNRSFLLLHRCFCYNDNWDDVVWRTWMNGTEDCNNYPDRSIVQWVWKAQCSKYIIVRTIRPQLSAVHHQHV